MTLGINNLESPEDSGPPVTQNAFQPSDCGFRDAGTSEGLTSVKAVIGLAIPFIVSSGTYSLKLTLDRLILSWHSPVSMSAALTSGLTAYMFAGLCVGIVGYASVLVSQLEGEGLNDKIGLCVWQSILLSLAAGAGLMVLGVILAPLFAGVGHEAGLASEEAASFKILCGGSFLSLAATSLTCFWTGRRKTWTAVLVSLAAIPVSVAATWILVFGANGLGARTPWFLAPMAQALSAISQNVSPQGASGAAWGTVVGDALRVIILLALFLSPANRNKYGTFPRRLFNLKVAKGLVFGGFGHGVQLLVSLGALAVFNLAVGLRGGLEGSHASAVAFSFSSMALVPAIGLGSAVALLVGRGIGAGDQGLIRRAVRRSEMVALAYAGAVFLICLLFSKSIVALFSGEWDSQVTGGLGGALPALCGLFVVGDTFALLFCGAARGAGDTLYIMRMTGLVSGLQSVILAAAGLTGAGTEALWAILALGSFLKAFLGRLRLSGGTWLGHCTAGSLFCQRKIIKEDP
jgi:MATE family multidrug resistance protein